MSGGEGGEGGVKKCFLGLRQTALLSAEGNKLEKTIFEICFFYYYFFGLRNHAIMQPFPSASERHIRS
jgi:hypothetical protein